MRRGAATFLVVTAAGCLDIPPHAGPATDAGPDAVVDDCPPSPDVSAHVVGGRPVVCGPRYRMQFSDHGYGFPDSLRVDGHEILGHGNTCEDEDGFGLGFYPAGNVSGATPTNSMQQIVGGRRVAVELATPFVVKVGVEWSASFGSCALAPHGRTTFTFFRRGRIERFDAIEDASGASAAACHGMCAQAASDQWALTSFVTLDRPAGFEITHVATPAPDNDGPGNGFTFREECVTTPTTRLGFAWYESHDRRLRAPTTTSLALVSDLVEAPSTVPAPFSELLHTTMIIPSDAPSCPALEDRVRNLSADDPQILINAVPRGTAHDGIYGGELTLRDPGLQLGTNQVTLAARGTDVIAGGWVLWLRFPATYAVHDVTKVGGNTDGAWYELYRVPNSTGVLYWFRDPLVAGETIHIDAHD